MTGPGGAGTTTLAASAAVRAARSGRRTVLLTRQPLPVPALDGVPGLDVVVVDPQAAVERLWAATADALGAVLPQLTLPPASSVVPVPGTAELAALRRAGRRRGRPGGRGRRAARARRRPRRAAVDAALVAGSAPAPGRARAGRRPHGRGRLRRRAAGARGRRSGRRPRRGRAARRRPAGRSGRHDRLSRRASPRVVGARPPLGGDHVRPARPARPAPS